MRRVAVIGAGAGGLCAAKHLLGKGMDAVVYEMGTCVQPYGLYPDSPRHALELDPGIYRAVLAVHMRRTTGR